jgi:phage baseplate assembly protein W
MADNRDHLGKGWRFPVSVNLTGGVSSSAYEENVRQSIFIILGTAPGERVMRPDFGCRIHDLMFAPNNDVTSVRAAYYCEEAIYKYEPRIDEVEVQAKPNSVEPNRLDLIITYVIAGTNNKRNLVYPFYLRTDEDEVAAAAKGSTEQKIGA